METRLLPQMLLPLQVSPSQPRTVSVSRWGWPSPCSLAQPVLREPVSLPRRPPVVSRPWRLPALQSPPSPVLRRHRALPVTCLPGLGHLGCRWCRPPPLNRSPPGYGQDLVSSSQGSRTSTLSDLAFSALDCPSAAGPLPSLRPVDLSCCRHTHRVSLRSLRPLLGLARTPRHLLRAALWRVVYSLSAPGRRLPTLPVTPACSAVRTPLSDWLAAASGPLAAVVHCGQRIRPPPVDGEKPSAVGRSDRGQE